MSSNEQAESDGPVSGQTIQHGTGVTSNRAFPTNAYSSHVDPFILFERFYIESDKGFPMHRHRGFEIVSYMLEGGMDHGDSLGVTSTAYEGDAMHIIAGGGIEHSEFPADGAPCNGLQLWVNLPREKKDMNADYMDAKGESLPTAKHDGATVTTIVGDGSPLSLQTPMEYLDAHVDGTWTWSMSDEWSGFLYGVSGEGTVDDSTFKRGDVLPVTESRSVDVRSESDEVLRVVAVSGQPHGEEINQRGPFVL